MSMYAYWLANTGLTVHKLTGLMTEGIGAEELYALQESQMKKIRVLDEKDVEKITQSRRHWEVQERWGKLQEEGIGFVCVEESTVSAKAPPEAHAVFSGSLMPEAVLRCGRCFFLRRSRNLYRDSTHSLLRSQHCLLPNSCC